MNPNFFLPGELSDYGDVALLKTLREYQRAQSQFAQRTTPAFYMLQEQISTAILAIHVELAERGHDVRPKVVERPALRA